MLLFLSASTENYVTFQKSSRTGIHELSICTWLKVDAKYLGTIISYATEDNDNMLVLYGWTLAYWVLWILWLEIHHIANYLYKISWMATGIYASSGLPLKAGFGTIWTVISFLLDPSSRKAMRSLLGALWSWDRSRIRLEETLIKLKHLWADWQVLHCELGACALGKFLDWPLANVCQEEQCSAWTLCSAYYLWVSGALHVKAQQNEPEKTLLYRTLFL